MPKDKQDTLTESDVLRALYHMYCAAAYKGNVAMSSETAIGLYNFFNSQKAEIERLENAIINLDERYEKGYDEVIKEFAEKTNKMITQIYNKHIFGNNDLNDEEKDAIINFSDDVVSGFANLVKETVGDV